MPAVMRVGNVGVDVADLFILARRVRGLWCVPSRIRSNIQRWRQRHTDGQRACTRQVSDADKRRI
jgi:hypothetical protein